jgi:outer membrane protein TolC
MKPLPGFSGLWWVFALTAGASESWTLEHAQDYALTHNPDALIARQRIAAAEAGLEQASASFWPLLQVQSGYLRMDSPMLTFGSILNQRSYSSSLNFNDVPNVDDLNAQGLVTLPLYAGGKNSADRQAAKANSEAARQDSAAVRNALGFEVSRAFYTVLKSRQFILAADAAVTAFATNLVVAQTRFAGGTLLKSDVLDIEVRLAQAGENRARACNAKIMAERTLRNLLGIEAGDFRVAETAPAVGAPESVDFSQRPELAAVGARERAAQAEVRGANSGYQPRVSAFGSLEHDNGWVTGGDGNSYTAGVMVQWNLWDGFSTRAKTRKARANLESVRAERQKVRLALDLEVEQARLAVNEANERLTVSHQAVEQAEESAQLTRNRFEQGLALSTQLIDAETALLEARFRRAEAESDQRIAIAALRKALAVPQLDSQPVRP